MSSPGQGVWQGHRPSCSGQSSRDLTKSKREREKEKEKVMVRRQLTLKELS